MKTATLYKLRDKLVARYARLVRQHRERKPVEIQLRGVTTLILKRENLRG